MVETLFFRGDAPVYNPKAQFNEAVWPIVRPAGFRSIDIQP